MLQNNQRETKASFVFIWGEGYFIPVYAICDLCQGYIYVG
jgi:hypothetical protein